MYLLRDDFSGFQFNLLMQNEKNLILLYQFPGKFLPKVNQHAGLSDFKRLLVVSILGNISLDKQNTVTKSQVKGNCLNNKRINMFDVCTYF